MVKKLIINADDFGQSNEVNEAVETAHKKGVVTSATIMANMPAAAKAVKIAKKLPNLGVGVHLNISKGQPLSDIKKVECLIDNKKQFHLSKHTLVFLSAIYHPVRKAITTEYQNQIEWLVDKGIELTHIDSHNHLHCYWPIFSIVCSLARKYKIKTIRFCYEPAEIGTSPWPLSTAQGRATSKALRYLSVLNRFQDKDLIKTERFYGIAHMGKIDVSFFNALSLYNLAGISEVMTHPSTINNPDTVDMMSMPKGKIELQALCDEKTKDCLYKADVELINYGQL